jgi:3-methyladenine DNA glycosylase AlkD
MKPHLLEVINRIKSIDSAIPAQRKGFKQGYSFSKEPFEQQLQIWNNIRENSDTLRPKLHAFFFLERYLAKKELHEVIWKTSVAWQEQVDGWGLCDALSKINSKVLVTFPTEVYSTLSKWNKDENLWKRRQSVVSLLYYSRTKKVYLPFKNIAALVEPLLHDTEYYVQKGVGWTMREMYNVYPPETFHFIQKNIRNISAIAFTIAIEKIGEDEKRRLKRMRKSK